VTVSAMSRTQSGSEAIAMQHAFRAEQRLGSHERVTTAKRDRPVTVPALRIRIAKHLHGDIAGGLLHQAA
jgi:hypothetical protein